MFVFFIPKVRVMHKYNSRFPDSRALAKILELQIEEFFFLQIPIVLELSCSFHKKRVILVLLIQVFLFLQI
jgi:hypothetical protein